MNAPVAGLDLLARWAVDPVAFVTEAIRAEPAPWQIDALNAINLHSRVAIRSGRGVGKSSYLAWLILWWLLTRPQAKIPCTAPSGHQLEDILWAEVRQWMRRLPPFLSSLLVISSDRIMLAEAPGENFAAARTARRENPEALQGFHSGDLLFLIDEAAGVDEIIFEVGEGSMSTPRSKTVMTSNPTRTSGFFFDAFHSRRKRWFTMRVNSEEVHTPWVDAAYAKDLAETYGIDSDIFRVHVLGEFPKGEADTVIPLHLVEEATRRKVDRTGIYIWGLDVARYGDDRSALAKRHGNVLIEPVLSWRGKDLMQTAGIVVAEYEKARVKPDYIYVDVIGMGAGVKDRLKENGLPVRGINVAEQASADDRFMRLRDELWFRAREWFEARECVIPFQDTLIAELTAPKYSPTSLGKLKVEAKHETKKRLHASPDIADAFVLTFAAPRRLGKLKPIEYVITPFRQWV